MYLPQITTLTGIYPKIDTCILLHDNVSKIDAMCYIAAMCQKSLQCARNRCNASETAYSEANNADSD